MSVLKLITSSDLQDPKLQRLNWNFDYLGKQITSAASSASGSSSGSSVQAGTHANRASVAAASNIGSLYIETDRNNLVYQSQYVSGVATWVYVTGTYNRTQSQLVALAATLTTADTGLLVNVTDYVHILQWSGAAWQWGPGEQGSGMLQGFAVAPGNGWHVCDGSSVNYLKSDGTTSSVTLPNPVTASYMKYGAAYVSGITGAANPVAGNNSTTTSFAIGTSATITVAGNPHTHTITLPGDPVPNFEALLYFRL